MASAHLLRQLFDELWYFSLQPLEHLSRRIDGRLAARVCSRATKEDDVAGVVSAPAELGVLIDKSLA